MRIILGAFLISVWRWNTPVNSAGLSEEFTWSRISFVDTESRFYRPDGIGRIEFGYGKVNNNDSIVSAYESSTTEVTAGPEVETDNVNYEFIFENNIPMGVNRWKNKLFITVPRRRIGIPSTLNYIPMNSTKRHNVPLIPYPDLKTNAVKASEGEEHITSVYRIAVDPCDRLWMADTGTVNSLGNRTSYGAQRIVIIDLNTDKIIKIYNFKESDLTPDTILTMTVVDVTAKTCEDAYAYFPDLAGFGLVVYSLKNDDSWRVAHNYFYLEPLAGDFNIAGLFYQWNDGVFSVALSDIKPDGFRDVFFHAMAGTHLYSVSTEILRNKTTAIRSYHGNDFKVVGDRGPRSQTSASDLHKTSGVLFLSLVNQNAVGCWNTKKPLSLDNLGIVQKNDSSMIYPSDLKIYQDDLIVLTNGMPVFLYSSLDYDKTNFRVWMRNVNDAVKDTVCASEH